jgi:outer membrane protein assembly factor BamB
MPNLRTLAAALLCTAPVSAGDWPQWLGPFRNNSTVEKVAPWKEPPKALWKKPVGEGNSSPVLADGRVFVHAKVKDKNEEEVVAYAAADGQELWRTKYERAAFASLYGNGPRATPAVHSGKVYTVGITGVLTCLDAAKGTILWQKDTLKEFEAKNLLFGMAGSPLVEDGRVFVNAGSKGASIVAYDTDKGTVVWQALDDKASYSSPIIFGEGKDRQLVFLTGQGVVSLRPSDGMVYWKYPLVDKLFESSTTPVKVGDHLLASSITFGSAGLALAKKDDRPAVKEEWKNPALTSYFSTPVAVGPEPQDYVYLVTGKIPGPFSDPEATLHCVDMKTGKTTWSKPKIGTYHAALLRLGNGRLLLLDDHGSLALLEPDTKQYRELCRSKVCGETWAHPALTDGKLYVRDGKELICLDLGK